MPSNFSTRSTNHSSTSSIPATPMAPTQQTSNQQPTNQHPDNWFPTIHVPATQTNGSSIFPKPPSSRNNYPFYKRVPIMPLPPNTPIEAYITSTEQAANKLPSQKADELINRILKQVQQQHNKHCNLNPPVQSPYRTQTGPVQGGSYSRQVGVHGHHGPTGLHQKSTNITTGHQHLQSAPQGPHLPPQKQTHYPS